MAADGAGSTFAEKVVGLFVLTGSVVSVDGQWQASVLLRDSRTKERLRIDVTLTRENDQEFADKIAAMIAALDTTAAAEGTRGSFKPLPPGQIGEHSA